MILRTEEIRTETWLIDTGESEEGDYDTFGDALGSAEPGDSIIHEITTAYVTTAREEALRVPLSEGVQP